MVFKRRQPLGWLAWMREMIYPTGGFKRATRYVIHRMSRLPDDPHRIARGVFAGFMIGFLPLPGLQFVAAWAAARLVRGNLFAALLGTFNTNPLTTPFFAVFAMTLGHWIMGVQEPLSAEAIGGAFAHAGGDLWRNMVAIFTPETMHWGGLIRFWHEIYVPYFIGALLPGLVISAVAYYLTIPLVQTYQKARAAKADDRRERRHRLKLAVADAKARLLHRGDKDADAAAHKHDESKADAP
ncbi:DUF2062 domain-containing protein [Cypionkella sp.]|uniref:DUF2062 domain-containing protein n=1 Tax=Cypionkella sp. TaxID=2811411 RepID=UPI0026283DF8|nr:DUF2062 domain-containing protein [Cypionkella sp.]